MRTRARGSTGSRGGRLVTGWLWERHSGQSAHIVSYGHCPGCPAPRGRDRWRTALTLPPDRGWALSSVIPFTDVLTVLVILHVYLI